MSIYRIQRSTRYTHIPNAALEDSRLSFRARGILAYLLSKPDDWRCRSEQLAAASTDGRFAVRSALAELEAAGYLSRDRERFMGESGRWEWHTVTTVRDHPITATEDRLPDAGAPEAGRPVAITTTEQQLLSSKDEVEETATQFASTPRAARGPRKDKPTRRRRGSQDDEGLLGDTSRLFQVDDPPAKPTAPGKNASAVALTKYFVAKHDDFLRRTGDMRIGMKQEALRGFFASTRRLGVPPEILSQMVDEFFLDSKMIGTKGSLWKTFISNAELLRDRATRKTAAATESTGPERFRGGIPAKVLEEILAEFGEPA